MVGKRLIEQVLTEQRQELQALQDVDFCSRQRKMK